LFFDELLAKRSIIDPRIPTNTKEHDYFKTLTSQEQDKLKYLIPLDGWFAMIIYPSLHVQNPSQWELDRGIVAEIERIKSNEDNHANKVERGGLKNPVRGSWPIEVNLDSCRHFQASGQILSLARIQAGSVAYSMSQNERGRLQLAASLVSQPREKELVQRALDGRER
jgi:hypothetical protein